ncbi:hypothetical protein [Rhodococcoides kroppenstedtii]|uniref:hypothetical protein n=1 Tax=Rhodococcoides kroppenstedtii TaxID=293050 RepID=UPI0036321F02
MTRTRTLIVAAAAVLVLVVVGAIVFVVPNLRGGEDTDTAAPPTSAEPTPDPKTSELNTGATGFGIPDADLSGRTVMVPNNPAGQPLPQRDPAGPRTECTPDGAPVTSPEGVMIQRNFGVSTLYSETDGPSRFDGLVLAGYSRTPQGAALAAANVIPRITARGEVGIEAARKLYLHDPSTGPDPLGDAAAVDDELAQPVRTEPAALRAPMAFRVLSCSDSFAVVELALIRDVDDNGRRLQQPQYNGLRYNMAWDEGTWKVRPNERAEFGPYDSLDGFTRWAL